MAQVQPENMGCTLVKLRRIDWPAHLQMIHAQGGAGKRRTVWMWIDTAAWLVREIWDLPPKAGLYGSADASGA